MAGRASCSPVMPFCDTFKPNVMSRTQEITMVESNDILGFLATVQYKPTFLSFQPLWENFRRHFPTSAESRPHSTTVRTVRRGTHQNTGHQAFPLHSTSEFAQFAVPVRLLPDVSIVLSLLHYFKCAAPFVSASAVASSRLKELTADAAPSHHQGSVPTPSTSHAAVQCAACWICIHARHISPIESFMITIHRCEGMVCPNKAVVLSADTTDLETSVISHSESCERLITFEFAVYDELVFVPS
nr:hypothetical protein CFP56_53592 [Quercus suber]